MIQRKPSRRLGYNGPSEVKNHTWLVDFPWDDLYYGKLKPKFAPKVKAFIYNKIEHGKK